jgi:poly(3-hydroxybutyrate) depolymerase
MKLIAQILIIFILFSCGSGSSEEEANITPSQPKVVDIDPHEIGTLERTIFHEGLLRNFILYVPESYDRNTATPMVFNFHGYGSNAEEQMYYSNIIEVADDEGFLVLHPQGTPHPLTG